MVNLTAVTILIPYITSISALMVVMRKAEVSESLYRINLVAVNAIRIGDTIPAFSALDENGELFESKTLAGKPALIKFFRGHW